MSSATQIYVCLFFCLLALSDLIITFSNNINQINCYNDFFVMCNIRLYIFFV